ncbi:hypothetical protein N9H93_04315 [Rhizobiaceae bacterium]|nr:hypothetical protein [Rhizobiaceae bacterium]
MRNPHLWRHSYANRRLGELTLLLVVASSELGEEDLCGIATDIAAELMVLDAMVQDVRHELPQDKWWIGTQCMRAADDEHECADLTTLLEYVETPRC